MMTLLIACMLVYGFKLPGFMYAVAIAIWGLKMGAIILKAIADA